MSCNHTGDYTIMNKDCKFCFNYTRPSLIAHCCNDTVLCNQYSTFSTCGATSRSLLEAQQKQFFSTINGDSTQSTLIYNTVNSSNITSQLTSQLNEYGRNRFNKYIRPQPMFIPQSVIDLNMRTANVGVPFANVFACKDPLTLELRGAMQPGAVQSTMG